MSDRTRLHDTLKCSLFLFSLVLPLSGWGMTSAIKDMVLKPIGPARVTVSTKGAVFGEEKGLIGEGISEKPYFEILKGTKTHIVFDKPITLEKLAILRLGWPDWSLPETIRLSINGSEGTDLKLNAARISPGKYLPPGSTSVDVIKWDQPTQVSQIDVEMISTFNEKKGKEHGTFRLAIPSPAPLMFGLDQKGCVPKDSAGVEFQIESSSDINSPILTAFARQFRIDRKLTMQLPAIKKGRSAHKVLWSQLNTDLNLPAPISPLNFYELGIHDSSEQEGDLKILSWNYLHRDFEPMKSASDLLVEREHPADKEGWRNGIPPEGFGRFGWIQASGLLVGSFSPSGLSNIIEVNRSGKPLKTATWEIQCGNANIQKWIRNSTTWTTFKCQTLNDYSSEIKNELAAKEPGLIEKKRTPQTMIASILAPGVLIDSGDDRLQIQLKEISNIKSKSQGYILYSGSDGLKKVLDGIVIPGQQLTEGWLTIGWPEASKSPLLIALKKRPETIEYREGKLTIKFNAPFGRIAVGFPLGYIPPGQEQSNHEDGKLTSLAEISRELAAILRAYPCGVSQRYREDSVGNKIEIEEKVDHMTWENDWNEKAHVIAPISPLLAFSAEQSLPVELPAHLKKITGWPTKYGPYSYVEGDTISYKLTIPPPATCIYPAPAKTDPLASHIGSQITQPRLAPKFPLSRDSLSAFKPWSASSLAFPLMRDEDRESFLKAWKEELQAVLAPTSWYIRTEPFSGSRYMVSFAWVEPDSDTLGDVNSGLGAFLYSLYAYCRTSGDWDLARENWKVVKGAMEYFILEHDWCQMQTGAREHNGASAIDMDCIGYQGILAYRKMAEELGFQDDASFARFMQSRVVVSLCARWLGNKWINPSISPENYEQIGVGISETTGFDLLSNSLDPDHVNGELALSLAWEGEFPEVYETQIWGLKSDFFKWLEGYYLEKKIKDWRKNFPGNRNNHPANICAHLYLRGLLGYPVSELKTELSNQSWGLQPSIDVARENAPFYSLLLGIDSPVRLQSWGKAKPEQFTFDPDTHTMNLKLRSSEPYNLHLDVLKKIQKLTINSIEEVPSNSSGPIDLKLGSGPTSLVIQTAE